MAYYFEKCIKGNEKLAKTISNFLIVETNSYLNKNGLTMADFKLAPVDLAKLASMQEEGYSHKQCADIFFYCLDNGSSIEDAVKALHIEKQSNDASEILPMVSEVLDANPQSIADFKGGNGRAIGFLIGQVMKKGKGKINASLVAKIMNEEINKR